MNTYRNIEEAFAAMETEAAEDALEWLQTNKPQAFQAINYLITVAKVNPEQVTERVIRTYGVTEEKSVHKMRLVIKSLARGVKAT